MDSKIEVSGCLVLDNERTQHAARITSSCRNIHLLVALKLHGNSGKCLLRRERVPALGLHCSKHASARLPPRVRRRTLSVVDGGGVVLYIDVH